MIVQWLAWGGEPGQEAWGGEVAAPIPMPVLWCHYQFDEGVIFMSRARFFWEPGS